MSPFFGEKNSPGVTALLFFFLSLFDFRVVIVAIKDGKLFGALGLRVTSYFRILRVCNFQNEPTVISIDGLTFLFLHLLSCEKKILLINQYSTTLDYLKSVFDQEGLKGKIISLEDTIAT